MEFLISNYNTMASYDITDITSVIKRYKMFYQFELISIKCHLANFSLSS